MNGTRDDDIMHERRPSKAPKLSSFQNKQGHSPAEDTSDVGPSLACDVFTTSASSVDVIVVISSVPRRLVVWASAPRIHSTVILLIGCTNKIMNRGRWQRQKLVVRMMTIGFDYCCYDDECCDPCHSSQPIPPRRVWVET